MVKTSNVIKLKLRPERGDPRYYHALIFPSKPEMYAFWQKHVVRSKTEFRPGHEPEGEDRFEAVTNGWETFSIKTDGTEKIGRNVGQILFHQDELGASIVTHEMTHAGLYWLRRIGIDTAQLETDREAEERFCLAVGTLVRQFWNQYYAVMRCGDQVDRVIAKAKKTLRKVAV